MTGINFTIPEGAAWRKLQEPPLRARYEHAKTWQRRVNRRRLFVSRIDRTPGGCWVWTGLRYPGANGVLYTCFQYRDPAPDNPRKEHHRSAFVWMMREWFPEAGVSDKHRTEAACGDPMCVNPLHRRSMKQTRCHLTPGDVQVIYAAKGKIPAVKLAADYGVSQAAISNIWTGKRWADVTGQQYRPAPQAAKRHIPDEVVIGIVRAKGTGSTYEVARRFGVSHNSVARIWRGERQPSLSREQGVC